MIAKKKAYRWLKKFKPGTKFIYIKYLDGTLSYNNTIVECIDFPRFSKVLNSCIITTKSYDSILRNNTTKIRKIYSSIKNSYKISIQDCIEIKN